MAAYTFSTLVSIAFLNVLVAGGPSASTPAVSSPAPAAEAAEAHPRDRGAGRTIARDFGNLYDLESFRRIGGALAVGGLLANTSADQEVQDWYGEDVRSPGSDDLAAAVEGMGEDWVAPALAAAGVVGELLARGPAGPGVGGWLRRTGRSALVGLPAVYYLQQMTGGNRPSDGLGSEWEPFDGSHGVSGHTFLGAVPFLTLARMSRSRVVDVLAVAASTLSGWGRLNDDEHYLSQVFLGWYLAWEASGAVADTERSPGAVGETAKRFAVTPVPLPGGAGFHLTWRF